MITRDLIDYERSAAEWRSSAPCIDDHHGYHSERCDPEKCRVRISEWCRKQREVLS